MADELMDITREALGDVPGRGFYARADQMLGEALTRPALVLATRDIERTVKFFIGVEAADILRRKYKEYFRKHPSYV